MQEPVRIPALSSNADQKGHTVMSLLFISWVLLSLVLAGLWACVSYMAADQRDETVNVDQFRRERAAVISQMQQDQRARFIQRNEERGA